MADKGYDSLQNRIASEAHGLRALIIKRRPRRVTPAVQPDRGRIPAQPIRPNARARSNDAADSPPPTAEENRRIGHHRWAVERCFAWQDNYRRVALRQEHLMVTFRAMQLLSLTAGVCTRLERMGVLEGKHSARRTNIDFSAGKLWLREALSPHWPSDAAATF